MYCLPQSQLTYSTNEYILFPQKIETFRVAHVVLFKVADIGTARISARLHTKPIPLIQ
jgi:hypothetical protein